MRNVGGPVFQLHWVSNHESLAAYEAAMAKMEADPGYQERLVAGRGQGLFAASSIVDSLYATVP